MARCVNNPITQQYLLDRYLFGLDLTDDDGASYPDGVWEAATELSLDWAETQVDVRVVDRGFGIVERHDFVDRAFEEWQYIKLDHGPVRDVSKIEYVFGGQSPTKIVELPIDWVLIEDADMGELRIIPHTGTLGTAFAQLFGSLPAYAGLATPYSYASIPGFYRVTYRAGFYPGFAGPIQPVGAATFAPTAGDEFDGCIRVTLDQASGDANTKFAIAGVNKDTAGADTEEVTIGDTLVWAESSKRWSAITDVVLANPGAATTWTVSVRHQIPADLLHVMAMYASMLLLNPAGDMIVGAGIASTSIGVDGLHMSTNTTSSATNAGYGARIIQYTKDIKDLLPKIRARYRGAARWAVV